MTDLDGDDVVYASILTRVGHSELHNQMNRVLRKDYRSINRHMRHASSSLTALRELQAAAGHLRPSGDWAPTTLQMQLKSIEEIQRQLETVMGHLDMDRRTKKRKRSMKRKTIEKEDRDEIYIVDEEEEDSVVDRNKNVETVQEVNDGAETVERDKCEVQEDEDEESDAEVFEVVSVGWRTEVNRVMECGDENGESETIKSQQEEDDVGSEMMTADEGMAGVENVEWEIQTGCGDKELENMRSESDRLPNGLVRMPRDAIARVKKELVTLDDVQALPDDEGCSPRNYEAATDVMESGLELEIKDSFGKNAVKLEVPESIELAVELEVPDSESDDEFSPVQEIVTKLQKSNVSTRLVRFPAAVDQLRTYLLDRKYLTITEVGEYLFAHKCITDEEVNEIGHTIEKIISVAMKLPKTPKIKLALYDLLATVEQLELTLGELPGFLRPATKKLSSHFSSHVETTYTEKCEPRFAVLHM